MIAGYKLQRDVDDPWLNPWALDQQMPTKHSSDSHAPQPSSGRLTPLVLTLKASGYTVKLTRAEMVVGRHSTCDIHLPLPDVSRKHCSFTFREGRWKVADLGSMNGLLINGDRVTEAELRDGDVLGIGSFKFSVRIGNPTITADDPDSANFRQRRAS